MTTTRGRTVDRMSATKGELALQKAGQAIESLTSVVFDEASGGGPAASLTINAVLTPVTGGRVIVMATFNAECSAANIETTALLKKAAATLSTINVDSGGSADHNVQGSINKVDFTANVIGTPVTYSLTISVTGQTLATAKGVMTITLIELPTGRG